MDTCWSATTGLLLVDLIGAAALSARQLLIALDVGEPDRLSRAMAIESVARAAFPRDRKLTRTMVGLSNELAKGVAHPHAIALYRLADGMMAIAAGWLPRRNLGPPLA